MQRATQVTPCSWFLLCLSLFKKNFLILEREETEEKEREKEEERNILIYALID